MSKLPVMGRKHDSQWFNESSNDTLVLPSKGQFCFDLYWSEKKYKMHQCVPKWETVCHRFQHDEDYFPADLWVLQSTSWSCIWGSFGCLLERIEQTEKSKMHHCVPKWERGCHRFRHDEDDFPADLWVVPLSSLNLSVKGHDQHIKLLGVYSSKMTFAPKVTKFFLWRRNVVQKT